MTADTTRDPEEVGLLLARFNLLDEDDAATLSDLIVAHGTLSSLLEHTIPQLPEGGVRHALETLRMRISVEAHLPELATLLTLAHAQNPDDPEVVHESAEQTLRDTLEKISSLIGDGNGESAEQLLVETLQRLADSVVALPEHVAPLFAKGLLDLWGDDPVWKRACG